MSNLPAPLELWALQANSSLQHLHPAEGKSICLLELALGCTGSVGSCAGRSSPSFPASRERLPRQGSNLLFCHELTPKSEFLRVPTLSIRPLRCDEVVSAEACRFCI